MNAPEIPDDQLQRIQPLIDSLRHQLADLEQQVPPAPASAILFRPMESD